MKDKTVRNFCPELISERAKLPFDFVIPVPAKTMFPKLWDKSNICWINPYPAIQSKGKKFLEMFAQGFLRCYG